MKKKIVIRINIASTETKFELAGIYKYAKETIWSALYTEKVINNLEHVLMRKNSLAKNYTNTVGKSSTHQTISLLNLAQLLHTLPIFRQQRAAKL